MDILLGRKEGRKEGNHTLLSLSSVHYECVATFVIPKLPS
jgi:hypothetical protein